MRSLLYITILFITVGCSYSSNHLVALDQAQRLMQNDPSAALSKLNEIDVSEFNDSATMAQWALLYSEALVANRLSTPTDTIVNVAIDYYGRNNYSDEFQRATKLKEMIRSNGSDNALATALYLKKEKEFQLYKQRTKHEKILLFGVIILLAAIASIVWMFQRMKLQSIRNESLIVEASGLKMICEENRNDIVRLESKLHEMLCNRFSLIDELCQTYYETQGTKAERKAIIEKVKKEIESVRTHSLSAMEKTVNDCRANILLKIKKACPEIKENDYQLLVYLACGLSPRSISLLLNETVSVIYKRKSRLKSKLSAECPDIMPVF